MTNAGLKAARKTLGLTQTKMGLLMGIKKQCHYSRLETGFEGRKPTHQQAQAVKNIMVSADHGLLDKLLSALGK